MNFHVTFIRMKKNIFVALLALCATLVSAQEDWRVVRGECLPTGLPEHSYADNNRLAHSKRLPAMNNQWDATKTYKQLVILLDFCDQTFSRDNIREEYERILNEPGYNESEGMGCMADYFRIQSDGLLNLQFDVYGPYTVSQKAQPYENPDSTTQNFGQESFVEATNLFIEEHPEIDFSQYDWNGNGRVNQVIFIYAGLTGNITSTACYGHIWPNTSSFPTITTPDGKKISNFTASGELWPYNRSFGIGTICHEFSHSLGLPDIYPTSKNGGYSICDEWDLMDGGNFTNYGWCPPNYTPLEKMLLGWLTPVELTEPTSITDLKSVSEGGAVYRVMLSEDENDYLLLENRQHVGWDKGAPGSGLMAWYVHYVKSAWSGNTVNYKKNNPYFHPVYADGLNYDQWDKKVKAEGLSNYQNKNRMNSRYLSTSPFPYMGNDSIPEAHITNITMSDDGLVSFDFMGGKPSAISTVTSHIDGSSPHYYNMQGQQVNALKKGQVYIIRKADGTSQKVISNLR